MEDLEATLIFIDFKMFQPLIPWDLRDYGVYTSKLFFFFHSEVLHPKFMEIRCYLRVFTTLGNDFLDHVDHTYYSGRGC